MLKNRALIIEDNPVDGQFIRQMLGRRREENGTDAVFDVELDGQLSSGIERLKRERFDIVLLDLTLPDSKGLNTFTALHNEVPDVPVVVLTSETDEQIAVDAVKNGAQDYLVKGLLKSNLLVRFVRYAIERHRLLEAVRQYARDTEARELKTRRVMEKLEVGFARLAAGDFGARIAQDSEHTEASEGLSSLLVSFDRTVEKLQELTEVHAQLRSTAAHDMRSPLSSMALALHVLENDATPTEKRRALLGLMSRQVNRILRLVDGLLDYFTITSGNVDTVPEEVDLVELATDCARDLEGLAAERQQKLAVVTALGSLKVSCDRMKLCRVLDNLVGNAIKYSRPGDTIQIELSADESSNARVEVVDHGPGIPKEEHQLIFERFRRAAHADRKVKGSGLGLAICKEYVGVHGGRIWVESQPPKGTRFIFTLPNAWASFRQAAI